MLPKEGSKPHCGFCVSNVCYYGGRVGCTPMQRIIEKRNNYPFFLVGLPFFNNPGFAGFG